MNLSDDTMLLSYINTKLRDEYATLDELCEDLELSREEIEERLGTIGYTYNEEQNRFL
ncbi:MAG: DUF4250 domain-containing protein [Clostridiales bacterium]|nr:DUF4250 domain-containing protein [Clostridiales bacterium]